MKNKSKMQAVNLRIFIIPLIIITVIFFIVGNATIKNIRNHYYNIMKSESLNFAKNYSHSLTKVTGAHKIINKFLEEKVLVASKMTALYDGLHSNELLVELADTLKVDVIYSYNDQGEVIYANTDEYIGWNAYEGHPVYNFMNSNSNSLVEDIRKDSESEIYYKYGYFKTPDGGIVQIGVRADKIHTFLDSFEMQQMLDEIKETKVAAEIYFIDNDFNIIGASDNLLIGKEMSNNKAKSDILANREYSSINAINGENVYEVYVPVYYNDSKIGTLGVVQSLKSTEAVVRQVTIFGYIILSIIFTLLIFVMISTYNKNKKLISLAYYDSLTGLPNREYLKEFLREDLNKISSNSKAILLLNCINFRSINLSYGFEYGDKILLELADKLRKLANLSNMVFRFSANRFVFYVDNYNNQIDLVTFINKINDIINNPSNKIGDNQYLGVNIGIVEINNKYDSVDKLLKDVSISLNHIKNNDTVNYAFFNKDMESSIQRDDLIEKELRIALSEYDTKKIYLEYQPQVDLKTNRIVGFEALARMKTESLGYISPIEFIDVAERNLLIVPLGNLILKIACNFINIIKSHGYNDMKVAVNISGIQLLRDDFTDVVMNIIKESGTKESSLELEITESILLGNYEIINAKLKNFREHKIGIALDDFGTGYSSFSRLSELNIDCVKIDKYFIDRISTVENKELISGDIISMSHKLGLAVVAEGVENEEQKKYLIENDCDFMQGYLFSKPLSEENALKILKNNCEEC